MEKFVVNDIGTLTLIIVYPGPKGLISHL